VRRDGEREREGGGGGAVRTSKNRPDR